MMRKKTSIGTQRVIDSDGWGKSSYCGASNTCVETSRFDTGVEIRDSKFPDMPHIKLSTNQFETLLTVLKNN